MAELTPKGGIKPGATVVIGGREYVAPQMNFGALREMVQLDRQSRTYTDDLLAFVLLKSLGRNYEGANAAWLNETLDGTEIAGAVEAQVAIMQASGLKMQDPSSGEAVTATV